MARKSRKNVDGEVAAPADTVKYLAAAYTRLSSDDKKKRGDSLETQRGIIESFVAASPDIRLMGVYSDNNTTGTNFERPGFQRMLADCENGRINCVIVKDLSRFGRSVIDAGYYLEKYLPSLNVRFIAITDDYDSSDENSACGIMLPVKNVIAESYALDISRKCRAMQRQNIADGRFVGRLAPYGYVKSPEDCHKLVIDDETAPVVRRIFQWAAAGERANEIARRLNAENVMPPGRQKYEKGLNKSEKLMGNGYWKGTRIKTMLVDRVYAGDMVQGKTRTVNGKEIRVDPSEWVCVPNTHEPVISPDIFERVQALQREISERAKEIKIIAPYTPNVFRGKVLCAHCGNLMHRHRQNKDGIYWFRCESQWKYGKNICEAVSVKETDLKAKILTILNRYSEVMRGRFIEREAASVKDRQASVDAELREINQSLGKEGRMLKSLYESLVSGLITQDEYTRMKADYEAKIEALSLRANQIRERRREDEARIAENQSLAEAVTTAAGDGSLTGEIIDRLIEKICVDPDKSFEISFRFTSEFEEARRCG